MGPLNAAFQGEEWGPQLAQAFLSLLPTGLPRDPVAKNHTMSFSESKERGFFWSMRRQVNF